jgi:hypothetical protein
MGNLVETSCGPGTKQNSLQNHANSEIPLTEQNKTRCTYVSGTGIFVTVTVRIQQCVRRIKAAETGSAPPHDSCRTYNAAQLDNIRRVKKRIRGDRRTTDKLCSTPSIGRQCNGHCARP